MMSGSLLFLTSCLATLSLSQADNGKTIQMHVGETVTLALDSNITTGFAWVIAKNNNSSLTLKQSDYATSGSLDGSGGTQIFTFVAKKTGTTNLQLKYWRSFEGPTSIVQRFAVTVQIQA
jgi:inhibitor of cysteine peptidase